jgi:hypothetical protein
MRASGGKQGGREYGPRKGGKQENRTYTAEEERAKETMIL